MTTPSTTARIGYIDAIKGFTILWVVAIHFYPQGGFIPDWFYSAYRLPLFFFMSGIFFRPKPFKQFLVRRINTLIFPFVFWYILTWIFVLFKYELLPMWGVDLIYDEPTWGSIFNILNIFDINPEVARSLFILNGPLWFLLALFNVQIVFYWIRKWFKNDFLLFGVCFCLMVAGMYFRKRGDYFLFLPYSMFFLPFYAAGSMYGQKLIEAIKIPKQQIIIICAALAIILPLVIFDTESQFGIKTVSLLIQSLCFIAIVVVVFSHIHGYKVLRPIVFFGKNTLAVLATHYLVRDIIYTATEYTDKEYLNGQWWFALTSIIVVCVVDYFVIKFCNRYAPWLVGKQNIINVR